MLIDSTTSSLDGDTTSHDVMHLPDNTTTSISAVVLLGNSDGTDDDDDDDDDEDGYSIISRDDKKQSTNVGTTDVLRGTNKIVTPTTDDNHIDTFGKSSAVTTLIENMILVPASKSDRTDVIETEGIKETEIIEFTETSEDDMDGTELVDQLQMVVITSAEGGSRIKQSNVPIDATVGKPLTIPPMIRLLMLGTYLIILFSYMMNAFVFRTIREERGKLEQYKHQVQVQKDVSSSIIQQKDDTILLLQEQLQQSQRTADRDNAAFRAEIVNWKNTVAELEDFVHNSNTNKKLSDQHDLIQTLQEQVRQLIEDATAMEVLSNQSERRYKREYRTLLDNYNTCQGLTKLREFGYSETYNEFDKCTVRKKQLKTEIRQIRQERNEMKEKLRYQSKELKDTKKEVKRQKNVIVKLQKQLADQVEATKKAKKFSRTKMNKHNRENDTTKSSNSNYYTESSGNYNDEYTTTFTWDDYDGGHRRDKKSIYVDNCWLYFQAKMDYGECIYDMKEHFHDHIHSMSHKVHKSFHNVMKHIRTEIIEKQFQ